MIFFTLMIMKALPRRSDKGGNDTGGGDNNGGNTSNDSDNATDDELADLLEYSIAGHSGDTPCEVLVDFPSNAAVATLPPSPGGGARSGGKEEADEKGFFGFLRRKKEAGTGTRSGALNEKAKMEVIFFSLCNMVFYGINIIIIIIAIITLFLSSYPLSHPSFLDL